MSSIPPEYLTIELVLSSRKYFLTNRGCDANANSEENITKGTATEIIVVARGAWWKKKISKEDLTDITVTTNPKNKEETAQKTPDSLSTIQFSIFCTGAFCYIIFSWGK